MEYSPSGIALTEEIRQRFKDNQRALDAFELQRIYPSQGGPLFDLCGLLGVHVNIGCDACKSDCVNFLVAFRKENKL